MGIVFRKGKIMPVYDKKLLECGGEIISSFDRDSVTNIGYDLSTKKYTVVEKMKNISVSLCPVSLHLL